MTTWTGTLDVPSSARSLRPSSQLLARLPRHDRIAAAADEAVLLIEAGCRLPLPLVLAGARGASRPHHSAAAAVDALATRADLTHTHPEDPAQMITTTALDEMYQNLEEDARYIYRSLGLLPVCEINADMTAAITELPWGRAE